MGKADIDTSKLQSQVEKQIEVVSSQLNASIVRIVGPELTKCIQNNSDDPMKILNCYDEFQKRVRPALQKLGVAKPFDDPILDQCLKSQRNMKLCTKIGLQKANEYINETFNDLKSFSKLTIR